MIHMYKSIKLVKAAIRVDLQVLGFNGQESCLGIGRGLEVGGSMECSQG